MRKCSAWMTAAISSGALVFALHRFLAATGPSLYLGYGVGYALFAALTLLALRRCRPDWHPALGRLVALLAGSGLAAVDVWSEGLQAALAQQAFFSALLGVALVQVVAKMLDRKSISKD